MANGEQPASGRRGNRIDATEASPMVCRVMARFNRRLAEVGRPEQREEKLELAALWEQAAAEKVRAHGEQ